jgi:hypothetical protein
VSNVSNVIGPSETWEPTNKTISIRHRLGRNYSSTEHTQMPRTANNNGSEDSFDTILQRILTEHERQETVDKEEGSF